MYLIAPMLMDINLWILQWKRETGGKLKHVDDAQQSGGSDCCVARVSPEGWGDCLLTVSVLLSPPPDWLSPPNSSVIKRLCTNHMTVNDSPTPQSCHHCQSHVKLWTCHNETCNSGRLCKPLTTLAWYNQSKHHINQYKVYHLYTKDTLISIGAIQKPVSLKYTIQRGHKYPVEPLYYWLGNCNEFWCL